MALVTVDLGFIGIVVEPSITALAALEFGGTRNTLLKVGVEVHSCYARRADWLFLYPMVKIAIFAILYQLSAAVTSLAIVVVKVTLTTIITVEL